MTTVNQPRVGGERVAAGELAVRCHVQPDGGAEREQRRQADVEAGPRARTADHEADDRHRHQQRGEQGG